MGTNTTRLNLYKPSIGEEDYGDLVNANFDILDISASYIINVKDPEFGAKGDGVTDDTAAIQAAIVAAKGTSASDPALTVFFPPGTYAVTSNITWHDCNLIGGQANNSVRIIWNGSAGGTMFTKPTATWGGSSFGLCEGINFRAGSNEPETFIDLTANVIDKLFQLKRLQFSSCSGDAIKTAGWVNLHWTDLRWDNIGGYIVRCTPYATQNLSSFIIDRFTYDHSRTSGPASGMIVVDNSGKATNIGIFQISNGRVEVNQAWTGNQAIVNYIADSIPGSSRSLRLKLVNIAYSDASGMANDCVLYRDTTDTTSREVLILEGFVYANLSAIIAGSWPADQTFPPVRNYERMFLNLLSADSSGGSMIDLTSHLECTSYVATENLITLRKHDDTEQRYQVRTDGKTEWGLGGSTAPDTNLYRSAADTLKTDDAFIVGTTTSIGTSLAIGIASANRRLHLHETNGGLVNYAQFTNVDTGTASTNGTVVGIDEDEDSIFWNYQDTSMRFATNNTERATILNNGRIGFGTVAPTGQLHIDQADTAGAIPVLKLDQGDIDDSFVDFIGTSAVDGTRSISSDTTEDSAKFGAIRIEINGVTKWIRIYDDES